MIQDRSDDVFGRRTDRRGFIKLAGMTTFGAALLAACKKAETGDGAGAGGGAATGTTAEPVVHPPIEEEPGGLQVNDWAGYGDGAYYPKEEKQFLWKAYQDATGDTPEFVLFENDDAGYSKIAAGARYDVVHPCAYRFQDYVALGVMQPWDTSLIPSFGVLNPTLEAAGNIDGQQYFIVEDWGFSTPLYRADKVEPDGEESWNLLFDERYEGKISWYDSLNMLAASGYLHGIENPWDMTDDELAAMRDFLISKKHLVSFMWGQSYDLFRAFKQDEVWIGYAWPDSWVYAKDAGLDVVYSDPKEGRISWYCGLGLFADSQNYHHAHEYAESWSNTTAAEFMFNYYAYGHTNTSIDLSIITPEIVEVFSLDDPSVLEEPRTHAEQPIVRRDLYAQHWAEVKAS
jgi:spermidine/putrescine-binding protein